MSRLEELVRIFKRHGYKMTPQRRAIIEILTEEDSHPTAEQVHDLVKERLPDVSLATVYNTLRELAELQEVSELNVGHGGRHYEISREDHAHRVCLTCGRIEDVPVDLEKVKPLFPESEGFRPLRYALTIYGYCARSESC